LRDHLPWIEFLLFKERLSDSSWNFPDFDRGVFAPCVKELIVRSHSCNYISVSVVLAKLAFMGVEVPESEHFVF